MNMSTITVIAVVFSAVWLGLLTLVVVILVRQAAILGVRLELMNSQPPADSAGLDVGRPVPPSVLEGVPEARSGVAYVLLMSAICAPCRELVPRLAKVQVEEAVVALVPGRPEVADSLVTLFPTWVRTIRDPLASELAKALQVQQTPFALEIEAGHITGKSFLHKATDLQVLVKARRSGGRQLPATIVEVIENARTASRP